MVKPHATAPRRTWLGRVRGASALLIPLAILPACIVDGLLFNETLDDEHRIPPDAPETTLRGTIDPDRAGTLRFLSAAGEPVTPLMVTTEDDGRFDATFAGTEAFTGLRITSTRGAAVTWGVAPEIPRAVSVRSPRLLVDLGEALPAMAQLSDSTTATVLALAHKANRDLGGFQTLGPAQIASASTSLDTAYTTTGPALTLRQMVSTIQTAAAARPNAPPAFLSPTESAEVGSVLSPSFLAVVPVDYDADGIPDVSTDAFDNALDAVADSLQIQVCLDPTLVRVVFQVDFNEGRKNLNCEVIDRFKWVDPDPGDSVYLTGAVHETQPNCADTPGDETCATSEQINAANTLLGNFAPNRIPMSDDGTGGDSVAGDNIWTVTFVLQRGLRLGYKFTYGQAGQGWTATEEWPGNSRLLLVEDTNDDGFVVRRDIFADETANKDRQNTLSPARGGRGTIDFTSDQNGDGFIDAHENLIDTDDDCTPDAWPSPGPSSPVLCQDGAEE
jgi:hypothetical protein